MYDLKPLAARTLLGLGIIAARKRESKSKVKHLQLSYCYMADYNLDLRLHC